MRRGTKLLVRLPRGEGQVTVMEEVADSVGKIIDAIVERGVFAAPERHRHVSVRGPGDWICFRPEEVLASQVI